MLTKTITYTDYNGTVRTEDFLFNLTKAELYELQMSRDGGMSAAMEKIAKSNSMPKLIKIFKQVVLKAYGEKSDDGRRFVKSPALSEAFTQTEAYNQLFMELVEDPEKMADFMNHIMPSEIAEQAANDPRVLAAKANIQFSPNATSNT